MDDNSASGDDNKKEHGEEENKENENDLPNRDSTLDNKKIKLNNGSSNPQGSLDEAEIKDDNLDSGVSADRSESTEGPSTSTAQETNIVISAGPSTGNVHSIILNITNPRLGRSYRKRRSSDWDSESSDSPLDSDDASVNVDGGGEVDVDTEMDREPAEADGSTDGNNANLASSSSTSTTSNTSSSNTDSMDFTSEEEDSDIGELYTAEVGGRRWVGLNLAQGVVNGEPGAKPAVLNKIHPKHNWVALKEIISREMGHPYPFTSDPRKTWRFEQRFSSSLHAMYRMKRLHRLYKHRGCVNAINFHPSGHLLASGSDDTNVIVWNWARKQALQVIKTGHKSNVFQSKFLYLNAGSELNIVTCARDGQVRLLTCGPTGGSPERRKLYSHSRAAHRLHVWPRDPHLILSAAEDGMVMRADLRESGATTVLTVKKKHYAIPLYSVHGHPMEPNKIVLSGRDKFVREYDCRSPTEPVAVYCPSVFTDSSYPKKRNKYHNLHMTCAIYNHNGTEILGSYNNEDIYLFNCDTDVYDKNAPNKVGYTHKYSGHRNCATFKGVSFLGPNSEYVASGSDCSYIYIWDKKTEAIVQWLQGDSDGVVNYVEPHPNAPILASSGLNYDVKIWMPMLEEDPVYKGLEQIIRLNENSHIRDSIFGDILPSFTGQLVTDEEELPSPLRNIEFNGNVCTTF